MMIFTLRVFEHFTSMKQPVVLGLRENLDDLHKLAARIVRHDYGIDLAQWPGADRGNRFLFKGAMYSPAKKTVISFHILPNDFVENYNDYT